jgi:TonB family protein
MNVQITNPCNEDWNMMKIGMISRHCEKCEKAVVDFTTMNRAEIISYLLDHPNEQVCGRMHRNQFDFHHEDIPKLIEALRKKGGNSSFLIMVLICMSLLSCKDEQVKSVPLRETQKTEIKSDNSIGEVNVSDTIKSEKGKIIIPKQEKFSGSGYCEPPIAFYDSLIEPSIALGIIEPFMPEVQPIEESVLTFAEKMPEFPGGMDELYKFIQSNLKYPAFEKENDIQGNVYVRFVVTNEGEINSPTILRGVSGAQFFDKEVLRMIGLMPKWIPGENSGKRVNVHFTMPIKFKLD